MFFLDAIVVGVLLIFELTAIGNFVIALEATTIDTNNSNILLIFFISFAEHKYSKNLMLKYVLMVNDTLIHYFE